MPKIDKIINFMRPLKKVCEIKSDLLFLYSKEGIDVMHIFKLSCQDAKKCYIKVKELC